MRKFIVFFVSLFLLFTTAVNLGAAQNTTLPSVPGKIAYIGIDGNVYVVNPQNSHTVSLSNDANSNKQYRWPTWSTDGRLAYFLTQANDRTIETDVFVSGDGNVDAQMIYAGRNEVFTYAYWSPQNCGQGRNCRELAVLLSDIINQHFNVQLIVSGEGTSTDSLAGIGAPFYYSWSPDGGRMLWQRNNTSLDIYDTNTKKLLNTLPQTPGYFQAPAWSPTEDRWLFGALGSDQKSTDLVIVGNDETQTLVPQLSGLVAFSWSPDGTSVAYVENGGALFIVDAHTGEMKARSSVSGVFAFFWSPDSRQIAYITLATSSNALNAYSVSMAKVASLVQNPTGIAWSVMDASTGATHRYGAFYPTAEMVYLLSFFDQFSQSHRIWSPDSRYLIYGETTSEGHNIVSLLDTTQRDTLPFSIADGVIGIWSFN